MVAAVGILSVDRTHVLFQIEVQAKVAGAGLFASAGERVFMAFAILVAFVAAPVGASSRSLLARLAPQDKMAQYFGLFAFSGKATAFLAPLLIALVTTISDSQRIGMSTVLVFLFVGFVMMLWVAERREDV
jgi:UMF1 family MFS transporter